MNKPGVKNKNPLGKNKLTKPYKESGWVKLPPELKR